ncbi:MAG: 30S ribosomal protein S6 [Chloroflexi bacterium]|nr:30S ribosomal protein S6 [Chloroflexota bacterium]MDL1885090.1 30S ribosomal protein S6 [Anaerolineae bacterium CFX8]
MGQTQGKEKYRFPMRNPYELTFIVRNDPSDEVINNTITQVQTWLEANNMGQVTKIDRWGRRKLAYELDKQREGYYVCLNADVDPVNLPELERNLKLSPNILRYLLIRTDN